MERREGELTQGGMMKKEELRQTPEEKEIEKLPPIALIYRDNDLFKEWIPKIAETLRFLDRQVEIQSFPAGTPRADIEKWLKENKDRTLNRDVLTDETIESALPEEMEEEIKYQKGCGMLDNLLCVATRRRISEEIKRGRKIEIKRPCLTPEEKEYESTGSYLSRIICRILENKDNMPKRVYIFTEHILDHRPFEKKFDRSYRVGYEEEYPYEYKEEERKAAEDLKRWLVEGGIPEDIIEFQKKPVRKGERLLSEEEDKEDNWIIIDRHIPIDVLRGIKLRMPISDFSDDIEKAGLLSIKPEELEKEVKKLLKEKFGKKEKKE